MALYFRTNAGERIVLFGLLNGVDVTIMRNAMLTGKALPYTDEKVKHDLTEVAKLLYEQMKLNPDHRLRIRTGETPVAWFLCAVHRIVAPRSASFAQFPQEHPSKIPLEEYAAMPPWFKDITPDDPESGDECNLPDLHDAESLPLAYWDGFFYALVAEIEYLYRYLQLRFGLRFERGNKIIHDYGCDCRFDGIPFSAVEFAHLLESCWEKIFNAPLTAALDYAIMQRAAFVASGETPTFYGMMRFRGLLDVKGFDPMQIAKWLADGFATRVKVAVRTNAQNVPEMLSAYDAARLRRGEFGAQRQQTETAVVETQGTSPGDDARSNTPTRQKQLLPALGLSRADSSSQNSGTERPIPPPSRLMHKPSNLALAVEKSNASTNLPRDDSGQRYPEEATKPHRKSSASSPPSLEPQYHACTTPPVSRKPVPLPAGFEDGYAEKDIEESGRVAKVSMNTKPSTHEHTSPETQPTSYVHASFDGVPRKQSFKLSSHGGTQSFPPFDDARSLPSLPKEKGSEDGEDMEESNSPTLQVKTNIARARPNTSPTTPSPDIVLPPRSNTMPGGSTPFGQHDQVTPIPRPKIQQRYVSAGGNTPLHEREVLPGFKLPGEQTGSFSMNKDDFLARLAIQDQMEDMAHAEGIRKASKASKASTVASEKKKKKSILDGVRSFSRKNSRNEENDQ